MQSITLLGSSSGRNAGDAALIAGIMDAVDAATNTQLTYEIPTLNPAYIREHYRQKTVPVSMMPYAGSVGMLGVPTLRSVLRSDLSMIFDAILFDRSLYNPVFNNMISCAALLPFAKRRGRFLGMYNVGVGPIDTPAGGRMLQSLGNSMDFITVRDRQSLQILRDVGVTNPRILLGADAAISVTPADAPRVDAIVKAIGLDLSRPVVGINVSKYLDTWTRPKRPSMGKERFLEVLGAALTRFCKDSGVGLLFVSTQHHDLPLTEELAAKIPTTVPRSLLSNTVYDHYDVKGVLRRLSLLFGMRLHATILASAELVPTIGLGHQPKVDYYFKTLGMGEWNMDFNDFSEERLYHHFASAFDQRSSMRSHLEKRIPELRFEATRAARIVDALHRGCTVDAAFAAGAQDGGVVG
jgi:polysaccharide pyruvyl transferase WcaK-like protein